MANRHLVLIPGLLCDHALWAHQVRYLSDTADVTVADVTRDDTLAAMAERVLAEAPRTFALAGLSMGGYVAQEIMRQAPERVERLALLATNARADSAEKVANRQELIRLADLGKFKGVTPRLLPNLIHPSRLKDPAVADVVMEMAGRVGQEAFKRQQHAIMTRNDGRADLAAIRVPTVVICGREDALSSVELHREMAEGIAGGKLVVIEDCGHLSPLERPYAVTAVMRYWLG
ncbi:MAG: alpha/beta fold hydrolase [Rhodospirillaceae bacterium]|nr:MAG: alpha/beta fold hydrolase [Rhodospirillaceae bacterium]